MGVRRSEWDSLKPKEDGIASYKERMAQRRLQELKRKKPHLFTVPQKHPRSEWCTYLMEKTSSLERLRNDMNIKINKRKNRQ